MRILNAKETRQALPMRATIEAMKNAYVALSAGRAKIPLRVALPIAPEEATSLFMPAYVQNTDADDALTIKIVSLFPKNPARGLDFIQAAVLVLDAQTGKTLALLEGSTLTAIRTGAASGAATDLLARPNSRVVTIFGAGAQGRTQLEAVCNVREIEIVWIVDMDESRAQQFADEMSGLSPIPADIRIARDPKEALSSTDIICTATTSTTPVYQAVDVRPGTHINGVGSYTIEMIENPPEMLLNASIFIDEKEAILAEAGEIVAAMREYGLAEKTMTELGDLVLMKASGRRSTEEITFFKSVGVAVQDAMAAQLALKNAEAMGLGQDVEF
jgi:alanine dehydrogenase